MADAFEVVIIGAGFAGAATAFHLAERGAGRILVLEREDRAGVHASGKNAALAFQLIADLDEARLAIAGTRLYANPPPSLSPRPLLARRGSLLLFDERDGEAFATALDDGRRLGLAVRALSPEDAVRRVPALAGARFAFALENPEDGVVDIRALLEGYLDRARRAGAVVRFGKAVRELRRAGTRIEEVVVDSGEVYRTESVVNAAGPWAGEVGRLAGVGSRTIVPRRRHIFRVRAAHAVDREGPFVWHSTVDAYFRPDGDALLTSACDATPHPVAAPEVAAAAEVDLRAKLGAAFPALSPIEVLESRACLRTFVADERFFIGRDADLENLVWVAALGGHGMSTSWAVGRLAAAAVVGEWAPELERFSSSRRLV